MYSHVLLVNQIQLDGIFMEVESQSLIKFRNNLECIFHRDILLLDLCHPAVEAMHAAFMHNFSVHAYCTLCA